MIDNFELWQYNISCMSAVDCEILAIAQTDSSIQNSVIQQSWQANNM